jgi:hypothetical protein
MTHAGVEGRQEMSRDTDFQRIVGPNRLARRCESSEGLMHMAQENDPSRQGENSKRRGRNQA